jgi:hypothetical protein
MNHQKINVILCPKCANGNVLVVEPPHKDPSMGLETICARCIPNPHHSIYQSRRIPGFPDERPVEKYKKYINNKGAGRHNRIFRTIECIICHKQVYLECGPRTKTCLDCRHELRLRLSTKHNEINRQKKGRENEI